MVTLSTFMVLSSAPTLSPGRLGMICQILFAAPGPSLVPFTRFMAWLMACRTCSFFSGLMLPPMAWLICSIILLTSIFSRFCCFSVGFFFFHAAAGFGLLCVSSSSSSMAFFCDIMARISMPMTIICVCHDSNCINGMKLCSKQPL